EGHDVDLARLGGRDLDALGAQPHDQLPRLARRGEGELEELLRRRGRHTPSAKPGGSSPGGSWLSAGSGAWGLGQQSAAHLSQGAGQSPTAARSTVSPRSTAARSTSRSRTIATNRASVPDVATRTAFRPSRSAVAIASVSRS